LADADCAKVAPVAGQNPVDPSALRNSSHGSIDQPQVETCELRIQFQRPGDIDGTGASYS
jgi:hypothetical protein